MRILLVNPTITSRRSARFPLAVLSLATYIEDKCASRIIDGNVDRDFVNTALRAIGEESYTAVGVTVMGGPQLPTALALSKAIRERAPGLPIIWGGYFPTVCPEVTMRSPHVDFVIRAQGEDSLLELLARLERGERAGFADIAGLSWRRDGETVHNAAPQFSTARLSVALPYDRLPNPRQYLGRTYLGHRTAGYQAALGCRFRCTFCGVATMFRGKTALPPVTRLEHDLKLLKSLGTDAIQFYDNNFFDREEDTVPLLEVMAKHQLPWWCFARSDALLDLSEHGWSLVRKSKLSMAYIGAESPNDALLHDIRKGTHADQTLAAVEKCRANGVIPELSFMLAPPHDPEGETERTFEFIRLIKRVHPQTEIMIYIYTPLPPPHDPRVRQTRAPLDLRDTSGAPVAFPQTADEWAEPHWVDYWCHKDAPWITDRLRRRILDFTTVLGCRFPTITDIRSPRFAKTALRTIASWRYRFAKYDRPWELDLSKKFVRLWDPRVSSL